MYSFEDPFGLGNSFTQISESNAEYVSFPFQYLFEKKNILAVFLTETGKAGFLSPTL